MRALFINVVTFTSIGAILLTMGMPSWRFTFNRLVIRAKLSSTYVTNRLPDVTKSIRKSLE